MGWTQTAEWRVPFDGFTWPVHFTNRCLLLRSPRLRSSPRVHRVWDDEFPHVRDRRIQSVHDVVEIQMKTRSKSVFTFVTSVIRCFPVFPLGRYNIYSTSSNRNRSCMINIRAVQTGFEHQKTRTSIGLRNFEEFWNVRPLLCSKKTEKPASVVMFNRR